MGEQKQTTVTTKDIARFLEQTGFVFETRANEFLVKAGYATEINSPFLDLEGEKEREIDIIASKLLNEINVHLVIECKQSVLDKWIFICTRPSRFLSAVKHIPSAPVDVLKEKKLFSKLHTFDRSIALASNYICYSVATGKKSDQCKIEECIRKLPKALIDVASRAGRGRHLFLPIALFAGQIFAVSYSGALQVEERAFLQYYEWFGSEAYEPRAEAEAERPLWRRMGEDISAWLRSAREKALRNAASALNGHYQLDFVTEGGLQEYIDIVEKEVSAIQLKDWPLPEGAAAEAARPATDAK